MSNFGVMPKGLSNYTKEVPIVQRDGIVLSIHKNNHIRIKMYQKHKNPWAHNDTK